jgi:monothiol glutaredoxin
MSNELQEEIEREIAANTILVYGKGTKTAPRCGFTLETIEFFDRFGYPFEVVDVLENMPKREALAEITDWPTLPKVFIKGKFYGDTDVLGPMAESGELQTTLAEAFGGEATPAKHTNRTSKTKKYKRNLKSTDVQKKK